MEYVKLLKAFQQLAGAGRLWRVSSSEKNFDPKYHAGAGTSVKRKITSARLSSPPFVQSGVATYALFLENQVLYFLPDQILVYQGAVVGAVNYRNLETEARVVNFVEEEGVPSDSRVIGYTWQYTNKNGGPDKRFASNKQIPMAEYSCLILKSSAGMNFLLQVSDPAKAKLIAAALRDYATTT
ncbi:MAG: hypothetical protein JWO13_1674 [Acidobacteriales bacterium]|nr:hypothetical protein [Terriglobales bacterium]